MFPFYNTERHDWPVVRFYHYITGEELCDLMKKRQKAEQNAFIRWNVVAF